MISLCTFCCYRYLEEEYIHYCVPSNVSSGLGRLPLKYIWYDGKENESRPTDQILPNGDKLDGRHAYSLIMPYFTTNDFKPDKVHELGKSQLDKLYPMVRYFLIACSFQFLYMYKANKWKKKCSPNLIWYQVPRNFYKHVGLDVYPRGYAGFPPLPPLGFKYYICVEI